MWCALAFLVGIPEDCRWGGTSSSSWPLLRGSLLVSRASARGKGPTLEELQNQLRQVGMPTSGNKGALLERLAGKSYRVRGKPLLDAVKRQVREAWRNGWQLTTRDGYARPPASIDSSSNPLEVLGECSDCYCALCRVAKGREKVRPDIQKFFVRQLLRHLPDHFLAQSSTSAADGAVYCSIGSGALYFDWELLELLHMEGIQIGQIWLVDRSYKGRAADLKLVRQAVEAFSSWHSEGPEIHVFANHSVLARWAAALPHVGKADIVVHCDAIQANNIIEDPDFLRSVVADGAFFLQAYSQECGSASSSFPVKCFGQITGGDVKIFRKKAWKGGFWSSDKEDEEDFSEGQRSGGQLAVTSGVARRAQQL